MHNFRRILQNIFFSTNYFHHLNIIVIVSILFVWKQDVVCCTLNSWLIPLKHLLKLLHLIFFFKSKEILCYWKQNLTQYQFVSTCGKKLKQIIRCQTLFIGVVGVKVFICLVLRAFVCNFSTSAISWLSLFGCGVDGFITGRW